MDEENLLSYNAQNEIKPKKISEQQVDNKVWNDIDS